MPLPPLGWLVCACTALVLAHMPLTAQQELPRGPVSVLTSLCPGTYIRVALSPAGRALGACRFVDGDSLLLAQDAAEECFALEDVDTVWVRSRSTKEFAVAGGLAGAVALAALGFAFVTGICDAADGCTGDYPTIVLAGVTIGGGAGL